MSTITFEPLPPVGPLAAAGALAAAVEGAAAAGVDAGAAAAVDAGAAADVDGDEEVDFDDEHATSNAGASTALSMTALQRFRSGDLLSSIVPPTSQMTGLLE
jgi:hypothetical protein